MYKKEKAKDIITFSRREQSGFIFLVVIIVSLIIYQFAKRNWVEPKVYDHSSFKKEILAFNAAKEKENEKNSYNERSSIKYFGKKNAESKSKKVNIDYFMFDPNEIGIMEWEKLGLSKAQANVILNYTSKGGKFKIKSDLKKIYSIRQNKYEELYPWIDLPDAYSAKKEYPISQNEYQDVQSRDVKKDSTFDNNSLSRESYENNKAIEIPLSSIKINGADTTTLKTIKGIGSYYAKKIIEYRDQLGGYRNLEQLYEIWNIREEAVLAVLPYVFINDSGITYLNINTLTVEQLKQHPYISWKIANAIVNYREQHGNYVSLDDLLKIKIISDKDLVKVKPYLSIE